MLGVVIGTYSSVYLACSLSVKFGVSKADLMMVKKEGAGDDQPEQEILPERFRNRGACVLNPKRACRWFVAVALVAAAVQAAGSAPCQISVELGIEGRQLDVPVVDVA